MYCELTVPTSDSNFLNSSSFLALYASISFAASDLASFSFWTRSTVEQQQRQRQLEDSLQSIKLHSHCLAFWTTLAASFSASRRVWIPWELAA
jgi:hypothetical protein